jgi:3-hydroxyacyl-[acyl-carrier-protein] dehydratase
MSEVNGGFGIDEVMRRLPHRYPMLLVDRVLECVAGERLVALKNVTANEQFFNGHFPGRPVVPGDQLLLKVVLERRIRTIWKFSTVAEVDGQEAASAEMMVMPG